MSNIRFAIIMGATSGIGYEVARILAQRGWKVGVAGRREDILVKMVAENDGIVAYERVDDAKKVAVSIVDGLERRKPVITINWLYCLLVFFWQMIPRSIWTRMRIK